MAQSREGRGSALYERHKKISVSYAHHTLYSWESPLVRWEWLLAAIPWTQDWVGRRVVDGCVGVTSVPKTAMK